MATPSSRRLLALLGALLALSRPASVVAGDEATKTKAAEGSANKAAEDRVRVTGQRVVLRDVMPVCPARACGADLGASPPVGSSRLIAASAIAGALRTAGEDPAGYTGPQSVRVVSAARNFSPAELADWLRPSIEASVPVGVSLVAVEAKSGALLPAAAGAGTCTFPPLSKRAGPMTTTVLVDVLHEDVLVRRVPVLVRLVMSEHAAQPAVQRGSDVTLVIQRRTATISAQGIALKDSEVGELAPFKVRRTGRVVTARVQSAEVALVVEGS